MAKGQYIGVDNVARKVTKQYIGVNNVARKVTKGYIGVNGVARLCFVGCTHESEGKGDPGWGPWDVFDETYHIRECQRCGAIEKEEHGWDGEYGACPVCGYVW